MDQEFEVKHEAFIQSHLARRSGERKGRLERGHGHGEKLFLKNVWWPLYRNFDDLHPEYEVSDWRGRSYFGDFAFLPGQLKLIIEIKGYGPHVRDMDRKHYSKELNRELYLQTLGYRIASFAYDDVETHSDLCRMMLDLLLRRYLPSNQPIHRWKIAESEVLRLALASPGPIRPKQVAHHLQISNRTAGKYLQSLCSKGVLRPVSSNRGSARIHFYELVSGRGDWIA